MGKRLTKQKKPTTDERYETRSDCGMMPAMTLRDERVLRRLNWLGPGLTSNWLARRRREPTLLFRISSLPAYSSLGECKPVRISDWGIYVELKFKGTLRSLSLSLSIFFPVSFTFSFVAVDLITKKPHCCDFADIKISISKKGRK